METLGWGYTSGIGCFKAREVNGVVIALDTFQSNDMASKTVAIIGDNMSCELNGAGQSL